jgi:hypothetical protein
VVHVQLEFSAQELRTVVTFTCRNIYGVWYLFEFFTVSYLRRKNGWLTCRKEEKHHFSSQSAVQNSKTDGLSDHPP